MDSAKQIAKRMKAKGLQRLRFFCQMCEKQCRDENGFKCHCISESHIRQMALFRENPESFLNRYSDKFEKSFLSIFSQRYPNRQVDANMVYQDYIADKEHIHMNATRWQSLSAFVLYLKEKGIVELEETERGFLIKYIDPKQTALNRLNNKKTGKLIENDGKNEIEESLKELSKVAESINPTPTKEEEELRRGKEKPNHSIERPPTSKPLKVAFTSNGIKKKPKVNALNKKNIAKVLLDDSDDE